MLMMGPTETREGTTGDENSSSFAGQCPSFAKI
jgi:hypothetical protein